MDNTQPNDVFGFLENCLPENDSEAQLAERQEIFRIALTQAMRDLRKRAGLTQKDVAERLGVTQSWVSKLENANHDRHIESILSYLSAIGVDFEAILITSDRHTKRIRAGLSLPDEELDTLLESAFEENHPVNDEPQTNSISIESSIAEETESPDFDFSDSDREKLKTANQTCCKHGLWVSLEVA